MNIVDWSSRKLDIPTASPLAAEAETALVAFGTAKFSEALIMKLI